MLTNLITKIEKLYGSPTQKKTQIFKKGQALRVDVLIQEGDKKRIQSYSGVLIRQHKAGLNSTITVRKLSKGVGVERIFPIHSPDVKNIVPIFLDKLKKK